MAYSSDRITREVVKARLSTPLAEGLDIRVRVYRNGMVKVNGTPINKPPYDGGEGWLGAANVILGCLDEFRRLLEAEKPHA